MVRLASLRGRISFDRYETGGFHHIYIYIHGSGSITLLVWTRHVLTVAPRLVLSVSSEAQYVCRAPKAAV